MANHFKCCNKKKPDNKCLPNKRTKKKVLNEWHKFGANVEKGKSIFQMNHDFLRLFKLCVCVCYIITFSFLHSRILHFAR